MPLIALVALLVAGGAAAAYWMSHRSAPPAAVPVAQQQPKPQPPSAAAVTVTEKPVLVETATVAPPPVTTTTATAKPQPVAPAPETQPPPPAPAPAPVAEAAATDADALYATAMQQIVSGDAGEARKTLHRVLQQDPHYAKAHFRMGEIALLNRNGRGAGEELQRAIDDSARLDEREQQLARIGLAITSRNRPEAERLATELWQRWPGDPDLTRIAATYPGMFADLLR
jgi:TolA-binding protein